MTEYEYNEDNFCFLLKDYGYNSESGILEMDNIMTVKFDKKGRPVEEHNLYLKDEENSEFTKYRRIYYPDEKNIPNIEIDNNNPIGNNNQGSFNININISANSVQKVSLSVLLPEGFTLNEVNTNLGVYFAELFELTITKQENNSWLIEIKPKSQKSRALSADKAAEILHIGYVIDEKIKNGTYNISVNSILFETKDGGFIPEPAITVPADVNRGSVGNEQVNNSEIVVYMENQNLYIQTNQMETVSVYTISGIKLYEATVQPGTNTINAGDFPQGALIVKSSLGWVRRVIK